MKKSLLALAIALVPSLAWAQGAVLQNGSIIKFDLPGWVQDKTIMSGGKMFTDNFRGFNLSHFFDNHGPGVCTEDALTNGPYHQFCFGHDASGNAVLSVNALNGAATGGLVLQIGGQNFPVAGTVTGLPMIADNATLALTPISFAAAVMRQDYAGGRGGPAVVYRSSASPCSAADNGAQVTASGGCWIAALDGIKPSPMIWGCVGDGVVNDAACFQAAVTAMGGRKLYSGPHLYKLNSAITSAASGFEFECESRRWLSSPDYYGIRAGTANLNLLTLTGWNQAVRNCYFDMTNNGAFLNTAGTALTMTGSNQLIRDTNIVGAGIGIDFNGNVGTIDNSRLTMKDNSVAGIRVGHATTGGETVDTRINNTVIECPGCVTPTVDGLRIEDAGGLFISQSDILTTQYGTHISPGTDQHVVFLTANNTYLGDTGTGTKDRLWIDTTAPSGQVFGLTFTNTWESGGLAGNGVLISNSGGGVMSGIRFIGNRLYANAQHGFLISAGNDIEIQDSSICASSFTNGTTYNGITLASGVSGVRIQNNLIRASCDGLLGTTGSGIFLLGSNNNIVITGNDLAGNSTAPISTVAANPTGGSIIKNNVGVDDSPPNVTAATTMTPGVAPYQIIRGTTTPVTNITPRWNGQSIKMIAFDGTINFTAGAGGTGQICNAKSAVPFVPFVADWFSALNCWTLQ